MSCARRGTVADQPVDEIRFRLLRLAIVVLFCRPMLSFAGEADWPLYRHDVRLTGATDAQGRIRHPVVLHEHYLGTPYQEFATYKPADDGLVDLDGDGTCERIVIRTQELYVHDEFGNEVCRVPVVGRPLGDIVRVVKLRPDRAGMQVVVLSHRMDNGEGQCYAFTFHNGRTEGALLWSTGPLDNYYSPTMIFDDIDGDGQVEAITAPHNRVQIFDGRTGQLKSEVRWDTGRNYGVLASRPRKDSKFKDLFVVSDFMPHVDGIRFIDGEWRHAWGHKYVEPNIPLPNGRERTMRVGPNPIGDFDGDGRDEIVCMFSDAAIEGGWHLHVRDCETGALKQNLPGVWLWSIVDLDGDERAEIVYTPTSAIHPKQFCDLHIAQLEATGLVDRTRLANVRPIHTRAELPKSMDSIADDGYEDLLTADVNGDRLRELIVARRSDTDRSEDSFLSVQLQRNRGAAQTWSFERPGHRMNLIHAGPDGDRPFVAKVRDLDDGKLFEVDGNGKFVNEGPFGRPGGFSAVPIVVDLDNDGRNEVIVHDASRHLSAMRFGKSGANPELLWRVAGEGMNAHPGYATGGNLCAQAADIDGDGTPEIGFAAEDSSGNCSLVCIDARGRERWRRAFENCPWGCAQSGIDFWTFGRFQGDAKHLDVYVDLHRRGRVTGEGCVLSGRNGSIVWHERGLVGQETAMPFGGRLPAVTDVNGDGADDVVAMPWTLFTSLSGKTGQPLFSPAYLPGPKYFNHWIAYASPTLADLDGDGKLDVYLNSAERSRGAYAAVQTDGNPLWIERHNFDEGSNGYGPVADLDGDGTIEVVVPVVDGHIACLDGKTGTRRWTIEAPPTGNVIAVDVNGDGTKDVVFGGTDSQLRAVSGRDGSHVWAIDVSGQPVAADVDGDKLVELLAVGTDGVLRIIGDKRSAE